MIHDVRRVDAAERQRYMEEGRAAFRRGEFYEAHEHWEQVWDVADDPDRTWIQGMIQIATGLHKLARGRSDICERLLRRALTKLTDAPPVLDGMNLAQMVADARACADAIARGERPEPSSVRLE
jgi:predicted metal-dependent hydrolase